MNLLFVAAVWSMGIADPAPTLAPADACQCGPTCPCKPKPVVSVMSTQRTHPQNVSKKSEKVNISSYPGMPDKSPKIDPSKYAAPNYSVIPNGCPGGNCPLVKKPARVPGAQGVSGALPSGAPSLSQCPGGNCPLVPRQAPASPKAAPEVGSRPATTVTPRAYYIPQRRGLFGGRR